MEILINKETDNLMKDQNAFLMLLTIAYNTKRDNFFSIPDVEVGEAFITADVCGMSQQTFRTTKNKLAKWGFAEFKPKTNGTIARITTDKFFKL
ncbi:MAG: hypothetical protein NC191_04435 [Muribaculaceae bacterium]|nr:hypothetical protein [Muribaculaceae bacterium]